METATYMAEVYGEAGYTWAELSDVAKENAIAEELERRGDESDYDLFGDDDEPMTDSELTQWQAEYLTRESVLSAITGGWNYFHGDERDKWTADGEYLG